MANLNLHFKKHERVSSVEWVASLYVERERVGLIEVFPLASDRIDARDRKIGIVGRVLIEPNYRRRGVATSLYKMAKSEYHLLHSSPVFRTKPGEAWVLSVGGEVASFTECVLAGMPWMFDDIADRLNPAERVEYDLIVQRMDVQHRRP